MHQVLLSIPEPCHEDWNQMTPTQQGRHCNACAKQVIDFSTMSDAQVLHYFTNIKNENVCGRAYPDQLERAIAMPTAPKKRLWWKWNYITVLFLFFSKGNTAKAQGGVKVVTAAQLDNIKPVYTNELLVGKVSNRTNIINGTIKDEDGKPVPFAMIKIKGKSNAVSADDKGAFSIRTEAKDILQVSGTGYFQKEIELDGLTNYNFVLMKSDAIVIMGYTVRRPVNVIKPTTLDVAIIDNANQQPVDKATMIVKTLGNDKTDTIFTSGKGIYKLKRNNGTETYLIKIIADKYKEQTIEIKAADLDESKFPKQIFLEKVPEAADYKKLDSVVVNASMMVTGRFRCTTGAMAIITKRTYADTLKSLVTKINGDLKIFPNPVQKGNPIKLVFKLKETGAYHIQIINAAGQMLLVKQLQAASKNYAEQIQTNASWSGGVYYVRLLDEENKLISTNSFIIQ